MKSCLKNSDCISEGLICCPVMHKCREPFTGEPCSVIKNRCPHGEVCDPIKGRCGFKSSFDSGKSSLASGKCSFDSDCRSGQYCDWKSNICQPLKIEGASCTLNDQCGDGMTCELDRPDGVSLEFVCRRFCRSSTDCPYGQFCKTLGFPEVSVCRTKEKEKEKVKIKVKRLKEEESSEDLDQPEPVPSPAPVRIVVEPKPAPKPQSPVETVTKVPSGGTVVINGREFTYAQLGLIGGGGLLLLIALLVLIGLVSRRKRNRRAALLVVPPPGSYPPPTPPMAMPVYQHQPYASPSSPDQPPPSYDHYAHSPSYAGGTIRPATPHGDQKI